MSEGPIIVAAQNGGMGNVDKCVMSDEQELAPNWPKGVLVYSYPDEDGNVVQSVKIEDYLASLAREAALTAQVEEFESRYESARSEWFDDLQTANECLGTKHGRRGTWRNDRAEKAEQELAALAAQVEELRKDVRYWNRQSVASSAQTDKFSECAEKAEEELAALRDGATTHWAVEQADGYIKKFATLEEAVLYESRTPSGLRPAKIAEIITRERSLDAAGVKA